MLSFEGAKFPFAVSSIVAVAVGFDENKDVWRICDWKPQILPLNPLPRHCNPTFRMRTSRTPIMDIFHALRHIAPTIYLHRGKSSKLRQIQIEILDLQLHRIYIFKEICTLVRTLAVAVSQQPFCRPKIIVCSHSRTKVACEIQYCRRYIFQTCGTCHCRFEGRFGASSSFLQNFWGELWQSKLSPRQRGRKISVTF
jgi:hypothetical protein